MNIYLIGFMGSGKSTVGKKLAIALNWSFIDLDDVIAAQEGLSIPEIFESQGEEYFREAESRALKTVAGKSEMVIACGGGTPCSDENFSVIKETGITIYLKMSVSALVSRLEKSKTIRPLVAGKEKKEMEATVQRLCNERSHWYEQADIITESLNADVEILTEQLTTRIKK